MARILVVDDEKDIVDFWSRILIREGFATLTANNGKEALLLAEKEHPDLIMLDINMPEMDGGDVVDLLARQERTRDIPVIFLTALITKTEEGDNRGRLFLSKSSSKEEIMEKIKKVLGIAS